MVSARALIEAVADGTDRGGDPGRIAEHLVAEFGSAQTA
jgi:hypothetical protein